MIIVGVFLFSPRQLDEKGQKLEDIEIILHIYDNLYSIRNLDLI